MCVRIVSGDSPPNSNLLDVLTFQPIKTILIVSLCMHMPIADAMTKKGLSR